MRHDETRPAAAECETKPAGREEPATDGASPAAEREAPAARVELNDEQLAAVSGGTKPNPIIAI